MYNSTRHFLPFSATLPAKRGTNRKLVSQASYPKHHHCRETSRKPLIKLEKCAAQPIPSHQDFAEIRPCHCLDLAPQFTLIIFQMVSSLETVGLPPIGHRKVHSFGYSICRRHRAWIITVGTIRLSVVKTFRLGFFYHHRLNSSQR